MPQVLTQHEVEQSIVQISDELARLTEEYASLAESAAEAEADYRHRYFTTIIRLKDTASARLTDKEAEARATVAAAAELRTYKLTGARLDAAKQALTTHRTRLDALRTLNANLRSTVGG